MKKLTKKYFNIKKKNQRGYTLLEYCAGAAIIAGVVFTALGFLGGAMSDYLDALTDFVAARTTEVRTNAPGE